MTVVIINPMSGPGGGSPESRGRDRLARAQSVLRDAGIPHRIELTSRPGHGESLAREALGANASLVCAWGGDGTANEIASVLAFSQVPLGIVPNGSGNGLARELGISLNATTALRQALTGVDRMLDVGEINGRLFFNVAGIGFDAHVARLFNQSGKRRGFLAYIRTSFIELFRYEPHKYEITLPASHEVLKRKALMVVIANTAQYGNGARIAPDAKPDDGRLDLVVVEAKSAIENVWASRRLFDGTLARASQVTMRTINAADIAGNGSAIGFHLDGEPAQVDGPLHVSVHPRALRVRVPDRSK